MSILRVSSNDKIFLLGNFYSHFLNLKYQNVRPETSYISAIAHR